MNTIIGRKLLQTELFLTNGVRVPVTKIDVSENTVIDFKTIDKHGYNAVQLGYGSKKTNKKSILGHVKKANLDSSPILIREVVHKPEESTFAIGEKVNIEKVLQIGDIVTVTGKSKGKGFAGVVKRHNFRGGPRTHGQSDRERAPGSIGQTTTPGRVYRGKRMAGRMGQENSSILNLLVLNIESAQGRQIVVVKGLVPGSVNSLVTIKKTGKLADKKFVPVIQDKPEITQTAENSAPELTQEQQENSQAIIRNPKDNDAESVEPTEGSKPAV